MPFRSAIRRVATQALFVALTLSGAAQAEIAVSANDGKVKLVDGVVQVLKDGKDTVSLIDLDATPPKIIAEIEAPASEVGPPMSVAIGPKEDFALITGAMKISPADPTKTIPDNKLTVIDLGESGGIVGSLKKATGLGGAAAPQTPKILATLEAGPGAAGVSINKAGTLALVANRSEGTVSVYTIAGKTLTAAGKVDLGNKDAGPSHVVFAADGRSALVTRDGDHKIAVLSIDGAKVEYTKRDMNAGLRPYGIDVASKGDVAVVANLGIGQGDSDTISLIDMAAKPPRVVNTLTVGQTPEGIKLSPDGKYVAVAIMNGSNKPANSPFFKANGLLQVYSRTGSQLSKVVEVPIGKWCQGIAWNRKSTLILVQCMVEEEIQVFKLSGLTSKGLTKVGTIKIKGGPAGIRTVEK
ncbi:MAG: YncE family protein [Hyphomicrobiaceae bacterium]